MLQRFLYFFLLCTCLMMWSCEDCTYISENVPFASVSFRNSSNQEAIDTSFQKIVGVFARTGELAEDSIGRFEDGVKYNLDNSSSTFELPIFTRSDTSVFVFYRDSLQDTLAISYQVSVEVLPPDCGYDETINNLAVIFHTFDSVEVFQSELTELPTGETHLRIYD